MKISLEQLSLIHEKAGTIEERMGKALTSPSPIENLPFSLMYCWSQNLTEGQESLLKLRLSNLKQYKKQLLETFSTYQAEHLSLSGWIKTFGEILSEFPENPLSPKVGKHEKPIPFEELLFPFLGHISKAIRHESEKADILSPQAWEDLHLLGLNELSRMAGPSLYKAFRTFKKKNSFSKKSKAGAVYTAFVIFMMKEGLVDFFLEYSALAKSLYFVLEQWDKTTRLLLSRFENDQQEICDVFFNGKSQIQISRITGGLSTAHSIAGPVLLLSFKGQRKLLYKPRSGKAELAFSQIISWVNSKEFLLSLSAPKMLDREDYFWQEYISKEACDSIDLLKQFYERIGQYSALFQVLGSVDYHYGNLIASGGNPVFVDHETLFAPVLDPLSHAPQADSPFLHDGLLHSVARGHLMTDLQGMFYPDPEGITGVFSSHDMLENIRFSHINQDNMRAKLVTEKVKGKNIPFMPKSNLTPLRFSKEIVKGYTCTLGFLDENRSGLKKVVCLATDNYSLNLRVLIRPSRVYHKIKTDSLKPKNMRDGITRSLYFERMAPMMLKKTRAGAPNGILEEELRMISRFWTPWFHLKMNSITPDNYAPDKKLRGQKSAKKIFEKNLKLLSDDNWRATQISILNHLLKGKEKGKRKQWAIPQKKIFQRVCKEVFLISDKLYFLFENHFSSEAIGHSHLGIKKGNLGPILLFATLWKISGKDKYKKLSKKLMKGILSELKIRSAGSLTDDLADAMMGAVLVAKMIDNSSILKQTLKSVDDHLKRELKQSTPLNLAFLGSLCAISEHFPEALNQKQVFIYLKNKNDIPSDWLNYPSKILMLANAYSVFKFKGWQRPLKKAFSSLKKKTSSYQKSNLQEYQTQLLIWAKLHEIFPQTPPHNIPRSGDLNLLSWPKYLPDHLNGGVAGFGEPLLQIFPNEDLLRDVFLKKWMKKYLQKGKYNLSPHFISPYFQEGLSGIIYTQLRLLFPSEVPAFNSRL